jgi:protease II
MKKPTAEEKNAMLEMFEASVNGLPYDMERWGKYYKPYGYSANDTSESGNTETTVETKPNATQLINNIKQENIEQNTKPVETVKPTLQTTSSSDILNKIKESQTKNVEETKPMVNEEPQQTNVEEKPKQTGDDLLAKIQSLKAKKAGA